MQTPKARTGSSEVPQRKPSATPRTARQLKTPGSYSDAVSSPNLAARTTKDKNPKVTERKSPRDALTEKKRPSKVSELELQLAQLQEDLKKANDQLNASESLKRRAQQEAEDTKKQLLAISAELEESQQQLMELSASEDARIHELRKISHDRDKVWESEIEAIQKQHSIDSAALASAMNEIQKLKNQLEIVAESEATQAKHAESAHAELRGMRMELTETISLVDKLKTELSDCRESEAHALDLVSKTQKQLDAANATVEMLRSNSFKAMESYKILSLELEESKDQVKTLEARVSELQADLSNSGQQDVVSPTGDLKLAHEHGEHDEPNKLKAEMNNLKLEVGQFRAALEASEVRYQEEYIRSTLQIRNAYEQVEQTKLESSKREAELEVELKQAKLIIEELKADLIDKEIELQSVSEENDGLISRIKNNQPSERESKLDLELKKLETDLAELKSSLLDKEAQLWNITEQNKMLEMEIEKTKVNDEAASLAETPRAAEREAITKLGYATEEANKSTKRAARANEQPDAAHTEMETELRRLKVQSEQWRKAAEAAAAMLSTENNVKFIDKTAPFDIHHSPTTGNMASPYWEDMDDDDSPKKRSGNMLKKIGVLWKRGQK